MGYKIKISMQAIYDHLDRLYDIHTGNPNWDGTYVHVDGADSGTITIVKQSKTTWQIIMSESALREFCDDMDYQIEFCEDSFQKAYRSQCRRALASVKRQVATV